MSQSNSPTQNRAVRKKPRPFRVLLVDQEPEVYRTLSAALRDQPLEVTQVGTIRHAQRRLSRQVVDLVLIDPNLPDGSGMTLASQIKQQRAATQTIVMTDQPSLQRAIEAIRLGAEDFIVKPLDLDELNRCVQRAFERHQDGQQRQRRVRRLRRLCKKLHGAREEISRQVDVLCNDLVVAYQELATQMQQVMDGSDFSSVMGEELDLENVIRKTLEYLLQKAGPTNAAMFLPSTADEYALGGYINLDCTQSSADVLLQHLADVVAPRLASHEHPVRITDNVTMADWIGDDAAYLADSEMIGFSCRHGSETLAVILLFRNAEQPLPASLVDTCSAMSNALGDCLAKAIRIHHRHRPLA